MSPFGEAQKTGEATIAGRSAELYEIRGKYEGKEHIIGPRNDPLLYECYECKSIEFDPVISEEDFSVAIPPNFPKPASLIFSPLLPPLWLGKIHAV